jgi:hypothetical protein
MRFADESGLEWIAVASEERTPRHHTRWYLTFHAADRPDRVYPMREVKWQTEVTAERTLRTMSVFELRRRLRTALSRAGEPATVD